MFRKLPMLLAAAGVATSAGASPTEKQAAKTAGLPEGSVKIVGVVSDWGSPEFEREFKAAKTGVPLSEAVEFARFLMALVEGRHVGQKYLRKFSSGNWCSSIMTTAVGGNRYAYIVLNGKGEAVCNAVFGVGNGPIKSKEKAPKGRVCYLRRNAGQNEDMDHIIDAPATTIKSGAEHFGG